MPLSSRALVDSLPMSTWVSGQLAQYVLGARLLFCHTDGQFQGICAHVMYTYIYSVCIVCISGIDMFHRICSHQQSVLSKLISHCSEMVILGGCPSIHINLQHRRKMFD